MVYIWLYYRRVDTMKKDEIVIIDNLELKSFYLIFMCVKDKILYFDVEPKNLVATIDRAKLKLTLILKLKLEWLKGMSIMINLSLIQSLL